MEIKSKIKHVKWNQLRRGSKVLYEGNICTVEIIDKPNKHNSFPKVTFDKCIVTPLPLTYFKRISY